MISRWNVVCACAFFGRRRKANSKITNNNGIRIRWQHIISAALSFASTSCCCLIMTTQTIPARCQCVSKEMCQTSTFILFNYIVVIAQHQWRKWRSDSVRDIVLARATSPCICKHNFLSQWFAVLKQSLFEYKLMCVHCFFASRLWVVLRKCSAAHDFHLRALHFSPLLLWFLMKPHCVAHCIPLYNTECLYRWI